MRIDRFAMERTQSLFENAVRWNLSESGVRPLSAEEFLEGDSRGDLLRQPQFYPESNGSPLLRERIAQLHPGAGAENVLVTHGCSEANYTTLWALLERSDRAAVMLPNYLQSWGVARGYGGRVDAYRLVPTGDRAGRRWALDVDSLRRAVSSRTRVIVVTNPNNPTGAVLSEEEMDEIVRVARGVGAWVLCDEVYRGAELAGGLPGGSGDRQVPRPEMSPTFWGRDRKVIVTGGLSKAYGLPGLRIGWIVAPPAVAARLWSYQDYTTLTPAMLSDRLARAALEPARREAILARTRAILRAQLPPVESWIRAHGELFEYIPPRAGAIVLVRYRLPIGSVALAERLRREFSVLVTPGAHFGIGRYLRIGYGYDLQKTLEGLARVDELLAEWRPAGRVRRAAARSA